MKTLFKNLFYSLEIFLHVNIVILIGFQLYKSNEAFYKVDNYYRFDSGHYIRIAEAGYEYFGCLDKFGGNYRPEEMCGNTGWFPGYALIIKYVNYFIGDFNLSAYLVARLFLVLSLVLLYEILQHYNVKRINQHFLVLAACLTPGFIYYFAMFPISAVMFFNTLCIYAYINNRFYLLSIAACIGAICYPTSSFVAIPILIDYLFFNKESKLMIRSLKSTMLMMSIIIGLIFVVYYMYTYSHDVMAYFKVSHKYGNKLHFPYADIVLQFTEAFEDNYQILKVRHYQTVFVILGFLLLLNDFIFSRKYKHQIDRLVIIYLAVYIFLPWCLAGDLSSYRSEALLFPFVFYLRNVDWKYMLCIIASFIFLGVQLSYLFFDSKII